jgi:hypothetical protein
MCDCTDMLFKVAGRLWIKKQLDRVLNREGVPSEETPIVFMISAFSREGLHGRGSNRAS